VRWCVGVTAGGASSSTWSADDVADRSWCTLAYWELRQRIGPLYTVRQPHVDVFSELVLGSGLCLSQLYSTVATRVDPRVLRARRKIGAGLVLSRESDGVWLYNRSMCPVFVARPVSAVERLAPGCCLRVMNPQGGDERALRVDGPATSRHSVQVSFGKGFGTDRYSRRTIHCCPCWLEILLRLTWIHWHSPQSGGGFRFLRAKAATAFSACYPSQFCLSVCPSHEWISRCKLGSPNLHRRLPGRP